MTELSRRIERLGRPRPKVTSPFGDSYPVSNSLFIDIIFVRIMGVPIPKIGNDFISPILDNYKLIVI
jgi:hypothetical protein